MHILLVEDDHSLRIAMEYHLKKQGYQVVSCPDGDSAMDALSHTAFDIALLDRMLPGKSGTEIVQALRGQGNHTPVLLITAMDGVADRVFGLDAGADDYLVKPFAMEEMMARIRALSRRPAPWSPDGELHAAGLVLDTERYQLSMGQKSYALSPREGQLMEILMRNAGQVLPRGLLLDRVWQDAVEDGNLDTHIHFLRKHLRTIGSEAQIQTVRGIGYQLVPPKGA